MFKVPIKKQKKRQIFLPIGIFLAMTVVVSAGLFAWRVFYYSFLGDKFVAYEIREEQANKKIEENISNYVFNNSSRKVPVTAGSYLISDLNTEEKLIGQNENKVYPIASVSKLMTALISLENYNQEATATVSRFAAKTYGNKNKLKVGTNMRVGDLLYPLLLESSNASAEVIAEFGGRDIFLQKMNDRAKSLGMLDTHFDDPSGLSPGNVSKATDLLKLVNYLYQNKKFVFDITKEKKHKIGRLTWNNVNNLIGMNYYVGGKNGYTDEANRTLVSLFDIPLSKTQNRLVALVLLSSGDRKKDTKSLINYIANYVTYGGKNGFVPSELSLPKT